MTQDTALTRLTVVADPRGQLSPADRLLRTLQSSLAGQFELYGELGRGKDGRIVYLARELANGRLVALQLSPTGSRTVAGEDYWFEVVRTLDASVPAIESDCPSCHKPLGGWGRYCRHCGTDLGGPVAGAQVRRAGEHGRAARHQQHVVKGQPLAHEAGAGLVRTVHRAS